jgi:predicted alpha/beta superfamily hydrolase
MVDAENRGKKVKKFAIGFSLGGLLTAKLTAMRPGMFTSIALMAPYFQFL